MNAKEKAVHAARLYHGSMTTTTVRQQQKLYDRYMKACHRLAKDFGMDLVNVVEQVGAEASRRGALTPVPGKDI